MSGRISRILAVITSLAVMLACVPAIGFEPAVPPTMDPASLNTAIALTAGAAGTQTARLVPPTSTLTSTLALTKTPTETASPSPTFIFILPTATVPTPTDTPGPSSLEFDCRIVAQSPADSTVFGVQVPFMTIWRVLNIGTSNWNGNSTDYRYTGGDKLHTQGIYDLPRSVPVGGEVDITVNMRAPDTAGTYTTTWKLRMGRNEFCTMRLTIIVQ
ncbi:MAG: NBR1-Ig-like domain-containing protein [Chloroflexota bacterium]